MRRTGCGHTFAVPGPPIVKRSTSFRRRATTSLTRERFLLVLLDQLGYGRVPTTGRGGITVDGQSFPVSHLWGVTPIHLLGSGYATGHPNQGVAGAAGASPSRWSRNCSTAVRRTCRRSCPMVQTLRLLRDSTSLVGSAYVEFDLEAIFDGDLFSDFLLLYTLCQVSRLEVRDEEIGAASCRLEQWRAGRRRVRFSCAGTSYATGWWWRCEPWATVSSPTPTTVNFVNSSRPVSCRCPT